MSSSDYKRRLLKEAKDGGWTVLRTKCNHFKLTHPEAGGCVFAPSTPGDYKSIERVRTKMRAMLRSGSERVI